MTSYTDERYFAEAISVPVPTADGLDEPFHTGLAEGRLVLPRCPQCSQWQWPPEVICFRCHHFGLDWAEVPARGSIYSWTRTWHAVRPQLKQSVPYVVVLVEIEDAGGIRLIGNLLGDPMQEITCGAAVTGVFERSADGTHALLQWRAS